jgi:hypothetical protein
MNFTTDGGTNYELRMTINWFGLGKNRHKKLLSAAASFCRRQGWLLNRLPASRRDEVRFYDNARSSVPAGIAMGFAPAGAFA